MSVHVCSLIVDEPQSVPADGRYHIVRFPFGAAEASDAHRMHQVLQPDGHRVTNWRTDDRSGLIWPAVGGWGSLSALVYWEDGRYTEIRSRFVRDPLNLADGYDSTCTEDASPTPGGQHRAKHWEIFVRRGTPLAFLVRHNDRAPRKIVHAQFKLAIHAVA
ncbi:hypothetical protein [Streptomyces sp. KR80]|uniref:hypothetical protein n=1 Tax=Streptomyces sp. KR80 TaxID=3457426 RepID=UPI003FCF2F94